MGQGLGTPALPFGSGPDLSSPVPVVNGRDSHARAWAGDHQGREVCAEITTVQSGAMSVPSKNHKAPSFTQSCLLSGAEVTVGLHAG